MNFQKGTSGWLFGTAAFIWWGLVPIYFKAVASVPPLEILAHRITWCVPVTLCLLVALGKKLQLRAIIADRKLLFGLMLSTALVSCNWYIFTWAVTNGQILATSLGYFINPIVSILMGVLLLKERLSNAQWAAVICAALGVLNQILNFGEFPWIALALAFSFAFYGLLRKQLHVDSFNGLLMETSMALPIAVGYILWSGFEQTGVFLSGSLTIDWLLISGGVVTAVPLIWFAAAAKKIPLNSIGFLQFIAPSLTFLLAVLVYKEPLGSKQLLSFCLIWLGLGLYLLKPIKRILKEKN